MYAIFKDELYEKAKEIYRQHLRFDAGDINNDQLYAHQNNRLRDVIKYVADNSPFYREHLKGLTTTDIEKLTIDNIHTLPFTTKEDLRNHGPSLAAAPLHKSWIYYETTGTTGKPTPCPRNEIDSIHNNTPLIIHYRQIFACRRRFSARLSGDRAGGICSGRALCRFTSGGMGCLKLSATGQSAGLSAAGRERSRTWRTARCR